MNLTDGGGIGSYKPASIKKVILLCIVPDVKETHENMQLLFSLTSLNDILLHICLRLLLIWLSCQTARSSFPCPYCRVPLKELTVSADDLEVEDVQVDVYRHF